MSKQGRRGLQTSHEKKIKRGTDFAQGGKRWCTQKRGGPHAVECALRRGIKGTNWASQNKFELLEKGPIVGE